MLGDPEGTKPGWTRPNLAPWVTDEEADFLLSAVELVAEFGERFLPLYAFNWQTGAWTHVRDGAPLDLLGAARPEHAGGPVPYAESLREARTLAETLPVEQGRPPRPAPCARRGRVLRVLIHPRPRQSAVVGMPSGPQGSSLRIPNER